MTIENLQNKTIKGTFWTISLRWMIRSIGLVSIAILARLLSPEDFGVVAIAWAIVALAETLTQLGVDAVLIRNKNAELRHFHTAWTIKQLQMSFLGLVIFFVAPYAADYYQKPELTEVLRFIALATALLGFENIGVVNFVKELEFHREFIYRSTVRVITTIFTIIMAFLLGDYMALIWGTLVGHSIRVLLSYAVSPFRPKWSLEAIKDIWHFSQWILLQSIALHIAKKGDILLLGRFLPAAEMGIYSVGKEVATLPTQEIALPVSRALLPAFAQLADNLKELKKAYTKALGATATIIFPVAVGVAYYADQFVAILLGNKWLTSADYVPFFCCYAVTFGLAGLSKQLLIVTGHVKACAIIEWISALLLVSLFYPFYAAQAQYGAILLIVLVALLRLLMFKCSVIHFTKIRPSTLLWQYARPLVSSLVMVAALAALNHYWQFDTLIVNTEFLFQILVNIIVGGLAYGFSIVLMWKIMDSPAGIEQIVFSLVSKKFKAT